MIICPLCQQLLTTTEKTWFCANSHSFDVAKEGYVNLLLVQNKKSLSPGDTPQAVQARRAFLQAGHYQPLRDAIEQILKSIKFSNILDIGCGEGYYTSVMRQLSHDVFGLDIAKPAVQTAAKRYPSITWLVASGAKLPFSSQSFDVVTSLFSPLPLEEMARVLKAKSYLLMVTPAPNHLFSMREALFDNVQSHTPEKFIEHLSAEFTLLSQQTLTYHLNLDRISLKNLIAMTPYAWKARAENRARLEESDQFLTQASFQIYLFEKNKAHH
jgi:23S rRNA (guanine745-N1)-methyltransferase